MSTRIIEALVVALEVTNTVVSESAVKVMEADLREYPEEAVVGALTRCRRECKHRLTLADILERLPGTPTGNAEAAWAEAVAAGLTSGDEARTIVVREAVMAAFPHQLCNETGDLVASRMAFIAAFPSALA
ncbi:MAG: hypothetical protein OXK79_09345, partial [Chloroflexota bacterium]|nr:hypothetical protein [Chloroflexota bacterium]